MGVPPTTSGTASERVVDKGVFGKGTNGVTRGRQHPEEAGTTTLSV